jgi:putative tricarboxylic transport membrane protein
MELFLSFVIATILGTVVGLLPGFTISSALLISYPLLLVFDPVAIIIYYAVLVSLSQYFGSVSATFFSIPGSMTALPALKDAHDSYKNNDGDRAIMYAAIGSFLGSIFAILLTIFLLSYIYLFFAFFSTPVKVAIFLLTISMFTIKGGNSIFVNFIFIVLGFLLGQVGFNSIANISFMTFGYSDLAYGLPNIAVITGLYVLPLLVQSYLTTTTKLAFVKIRFSSYSFHIKNLFYKRYIILRSSVIGYLSGFIPGSSFLLGTILSYNLENQISKNKQDKDIKMNRLLAAEVANNSGALSSLLPLLLVGIPITTSQVIIYDLIINTGFIFSALFLQEIFFILFIAYFFSSVIGIILSGKYANFVSIITKVDFKYISLFLIPFQLVLILYIGYINYQITLYLITFLLMCLVGFVLYKYDKMPIIIGFILSSPIFNSVYTLMFLF